MASVKCVRCSAENDLASTAGYCDRCGKKLPDENNPEKTTDSRNRLTAPPSATQRLPRPLGDPLRLLRLYMIGVAVLLFLWCCHEARSLEAAALLLRWGLWTEGADLIRGVEA